LVEVITFLTKQISRYGTKSGYYTQIVRHAFETRTSFRAIAPKNGLAERILGKLFSLCIGCPPRDQRVAAAELRFWLAWQKRKQDIFHVLNMEDHLPLLRYWKNVPQNLVATLHYPPTHWGEADLLRLSKLTMGIVLCRRDAEFFKRYVRHVHLILHGVDKEFFRPAPRSTPSLRNLLYVGNWLRDFQLLVDTFLLLNRSQKEICLDIVVEEKWRYETALVRLEGHPAVRWHHAASDEELKRMYQEAFLLLLPLQETSANNAIVEALACGLPIVANAVGGISDYGGNTVFELTQEARPEAFAMLVESYLRDPRRRERVGRQCRAFAEQHLSWQSVWAQHRSVYHTLSGD
jgi:glycosyltransferase involved in cell wall biosynthesis